MDVFANPVQDRNIPERNTMHLRRCFMKYAKKMLAVTIMMLPMLAVAQLPSNQKIITDVPFEFTVGNKVVPAGQWTTQLASRDGERLLQFSNRNAKITVISSSLPGESKIAPAESSLTFHKYGDSYFLVAINVEGNRANYRLRESKAEAELRSENRPVSEEILVASLE
jgi:hypothetical protein